MDGKKKKNRKKKGNQSKVMDDSASNAEATLVSEPEHGSGPDHNHHVQILANSDVQSIGVSESDMELERHKTYEAKFVKLQEELIHFEDEKCLWLQKQASLEDKIRVLQNEVESCTKKEANLEEKLKDIQIGNDALIQKQVILEDKVKHIESINDSWNLKETSLKEMIERSDEVRQDLQLQVKCLQESSDGLSRENQQLAKCIQILEMRIQRLEHKASFHGSSTVQTAELFEEKDPPHKIESAHATVERLNEENVGADKVAHDNTLKMKVNGLFTEVPNHQQIVPVEPSLSELDRAVGPRDHASELDYDINIRNSTELDADSEVGLDESRISEDVVSVPLDDIQVHDTDSPAVSSSSSNPAVPLSDAPLIGAPFRLISFMTKYVSGADLVSHNRSN